MAKNKTSKKIIIGNWKMNPATLEEAKRIYDSAKKVSATLKKVDVIVCPPFIYTKYFADKENKGNFSIGAQNAYSIETGSFTGEVSPAMLKDLGVTHVILGHSERRAMGETDELIAKKVAMVLELGMTAILCVGEKERNEKGEHLEFLTNQIKNSLDKVPKAKIGGNTAKLMVAYEPIWAIGAKDAMQPETVCEMSLFVKKILADMYGRESAVSTPILYGGSVNFKNAGDIIVKGEVDGLLVGRESVNPPGFVELLKVVETL